MIPMLYVDCPSPAAASAGASAVASVPAGPRHDTVSAIARVASARNGRRLALSFFILRLPVVLSRPQPIRYGRPHPTIVTPMLELRLRLYLVVFTLVTGVLACSRPATRTAIADRASSDVAPGSA